MPKRFDCIRARGELDVEIGAKTVGVRRMPTPRPLATFVLTMSSGSDGTEPVSIRFRVRSASWTWRAVTVEWRYRTAAWLHFGGTGGVNGRWPCLYRAGIRFDGRGNVTRVLLHGYAIEEPGRVTNAFVMSLAEGS